MSRLRADIPTMAGAPTGSYVIKNTRLTTDNFVLEYDNSGFVVVTSDQFDVAPFTGYIVKRSQDNSGTDVDWSAIVQYPFYWSGTFVSPDTGSTTIAREPVTFYQETNPAPMIDAEGRIDLELAYNAFLDFLISAGAVVVNDDNGLSIMQGTSYPHQIRFVPQQGENPNAAIYSNVDTGSLTLSANGNGNYTQGLHEFIALDNSAFESIFEVVSDATDGQYVRSRGNNADPKGFMSSVFDGATLVPTAGFDTDGDKIRIRTSKTPASAADTGNAGDIAWDANYLYACVASDTWKRVAIATW